MLLVLFGCTPAAQPTQSPVTPSQSEAAVSADANSAAISFTDDDGRQISLDQPAQRIITLYSAHAENLYTLGVGDRIIGAHSTCTYPAEAAFLPRFDYNADPEKVIAADPDCVLIRPFITRKSPDFVKALENAGITVVSLYPETLDAFDGYIEKLALLTGTQDAAARELEKLHASLDEIGQTAASVAAKQRVFFESTEENLRTVTPDSMAGLAISFAGGENVAADAPPVSEGSSIASFGAENILALADEIDVYVSQRGAMNAGGNLHSISIRPGFDTVKAVRDSRVYVINEKLISSPTFRYPQGVRELARFLYPDLFDDLSAYMVDRPATRRDLANILLRAQHLPVYLPSSSKYYEEQQAGHVYGMFADVGWQDSDFDAIETAVNTGAIDWEREGNTQYFHPDTPITREALAKALFILHDFEILTPVAQVADLGDCENANIVQTVVDYALFPLLDGKFQPDRSMTCREIVEVLQLANQTV